MKYPTAPRTDLIDILHGVAVRRSVPPLESADDPATAAWVGARKRADPRPARHAAARRPGRAPARAAPRPARCRFRRCAANRLFFTENDGTRAQPTLYCAQGGSGLGATSWTETAVLVDPNGLDADGTTAITRLRTGRRRRSRRLRAVAPRQRRAGAAGPRRRVGRPALADRLEWVKFASIAWCGDGVFLHALSGARHGAARARTVFLPGLVASRRRPAGGAIGWSITGRMRPEVVFEVNVTSDDRHLVITSHHGASDNAEMHVVGLEPDSVRDPDVRCRAPLVTGFSAGWHFIDGRDGRCISAPTPTRRSAASSASISTRRLPGRARGRRRVARHDRRRGGRRTDGCSSARCGTPAAG